MLKPYIRTLLLGLIATADLNKVTEFMQSAGWLEIVTHPIAIKNSLENLREELRIDGDREIENQKEKTMETKKSSPLFWMATRLFVAYTVLTVIALAWAWLVHSLPQAILFSTLWLLSFALYQEWKHGE